MTIIDSQVHAYAERILLLETDLSRRQMAWERDRVAADGQYARLRHEVQRMQAQRGMYEHQVLKALLGRKAGETLELESCRTCGRPWRKPSKGHRNGKPKAKN